MRMMLILLSALLVNIGLFLIMENMIARDDGRLINAYEAHTIEFVRTQIEDQTRKKDRRKKPPPKPQETKKPKARLDELLTQNMQLPTPVSAMDIKSLLTGNGIAIGGTRLVDNEQGVMIDTVMERDLTPISKLPPQYPHHAAVREQEGFVRLLVVVIEDGTVGDIQVLESQPRRVFDKAAISAVRRWRYQPVVRNGRPVRVKVTLTIDFELEDE